MTIMTLPAARAADRSREAVLRWAAALQADRYLVAAIPADDQGPAHRRLLTPAELERALGWLRWLNTSGHHVVGRPWATQHVLVDDLTPAALDALLRRHRPAAVVESSPTNFQVWLTLSSTPVDPAVAGAAARLLAARHGGDRGAASPAQPGRIPGFTNRKARHRRPDGLHPYALLCSADGPVVDPAGAEILAEAAALAREEPRSTPAVRVVPGRRRALAPRTPEEEHAEASARVAATLPPGAMLDRSRVDHAVAVRLLARGLSAAEARAVVMAGGKARGMGVGAAAYADRTVRAAMAALGGRPPPWGDAR